MATRMTVQNEGLTGAPVSAVSTRGSSSKGARLATINGRRYERLVNNICAKFRSPHLENVPLSTMTHADLGGCCSNKNDLQLNWHKNRDTTIEIKVHTAPDWIQAALVPCMASPIGWIVKDREKNAAMNHVFNDYVSCQPTSLFPGGIPPFLARSGITHKEWDSVKSSFSDVYFDIDRDTIAKSYALKGVQYIQISKYGLYHCIEDVCGLGTIPFHCFQRLRVRCKRHGRKCPDTGQHIPSTVTASLRPVLRDLARSPVSLERPGDFACIF